MAERLILNHLAVRVLLDGQSLLVQPKVAQIQKRAEEQEALTLSSGEKAATAGGQTGLSVEGKEGAGTGGSAVRGGPTLLAPQLRRFHASVTIDPLRLGRDASQIAEEVVRHLTGLVGAKVEITLEVRAELTDGAPEKLVRDVTENCRTLRFDNFGFEEV